MPTVPNLPLSADCSHLTPISSKLPTYRHQQAHHHDDQLEVHGCMMLLRTHTPVYIVLTVWGSVQKGKGGHLLIVFTFVPITVIVLKLNRRSWPDKGYSRIAFYICRHWHVASAPLYGGLWVMPKELSYKRVAFPVYLKCHISFICGTALQEITVDISFRAQKFHSKLRLERVPYCQYV
jgi:hypothetical protein